MDELLQQSLKRYEIKRSMEDFALQKGYFPFQPALFEKYEQFTCKNPSLTREQMVVVMNGYQQLLLRPDITTAMIKEVLPNINQKDKVKLFYQSTNYRSSKKSVKEISQFGIEILGEISASSECEIVEMACNYLKDYHFILEIGHTGFLEGLLDECNLTKNERYELKKLIYAKDFHGCTQFMNQKNSKDEVKEVFEKLFTFHGKLDQLITIEPQYLLNEKMQNAVESFRKFTEINSNIYFDLSMINELDYYEGIIFKGYYPNLPRAVLSGGRYDSLTKEYGQKIGAIGFSIDVNAWIQAKERDNTWNG
ncbi:ATP phosphoribosyltransferase regulatory subunit [Bacillus sp. RG28]|uniref:ATP phosphoribosyltransferase regulatory subunit n=1 Tax=Gottfriedia endophytica TaxID=2820819 RepID=A0A940NRX3_9BACI|nr:ATP phosphoribosyltransferase regulatory subunit [Gottfriedia endophytica]MBP0725726.1 ATP phosphoribosyltransferase regulatory subunit [Gottfriedia endophytica]